MWPDGPWNKEPDRVQFEHEGLPCLLIRNELGAWCGYVGVYIDSPLFGICDSEIELPSHCEVNSFESSVEREDKLWLELPLPEDVPIDVNNIEEAIDNHVRVPLRVWFFGFDCCHYRDLVPGMGVLTKGIDKHMRGVYRDYKYVVQVCKDMAEAIRLIEHGLRNKARGLAVS